MGQFEDYNYEENDGLFTRPTLDLYVLNKYWNFLTKDLSLEELADLEKARSVLEKYEKIYSIYEYVADFSQTMTVLEIR